MPLPKLQILFSFFSPSIGAQTLNRIFPPRATSNSSNSNRRLKRKLGFGFLSLPSRNYKKGATPRNCAGRANQQGSVSGGAYARVFDRFDHRRPGTFLYTFVKFVLA